MSFKEPFGPRNELIIRSYQNDDHPFIFDSWSRCHLEQSRDHPFGRGHLAHMRRPTYFKRQEWLVDLCLGWFNNDTAVIELAVEPGMIIGYICGYRSRRWLHFLYVGNLYRRRGYATALLREFFPTDETITLTQWTPAARHYLSKWHLSYDPFTIHDMILEERESWRDPPE